MSDPLKVEVGDTVNLFYNPDPGCEHGKSFTATVLHVPQDVGDFWHFLVTSTNMNYVLLQNPVSPHLDQIVLVRKWTE
jgi:hypothetical protein